MFGPRVLDPGQKVGYYLLRSLTVAVEVEEVRMQELSGVPPSLEDYPLLGALDQGPTRPHHK